MAIVFGKRLETLEVASTNTRPDWVQADPVWIQNALEHALAKPTGGWYVIDASRSIRNQPRLFTIHHERLVVWRDADGVVAAPDVCPHMGASLSCGRVENGKIICPWHGLSLGRKGHGLWRPLKTYEDGVLAWVRLPTTEQLTEAPYLPTRPAQFVDAVIRVSARCAPHDVLANRLDPWHGVHFHAHSFSRLHVVEMDQTQIRLRVAYRITKFFEMEVEATFHCSDSRTIVMTIVDGDGKGSVVETHATPIDSEHTSIIEATLATSNRALFFPWAQRMAPVLRPLIQMRARRLWMDDAAYAERLSELRKDSHLAQVIPLRTRRKPRLKST